MENDNIYAMPMCTLRALRLKDFSIRFLIAYGMSLNLMFYDYDYYTILYVKFPDTHTHPAPGWRDDSINFPSSHFLRIALS